MRTVGGEEESLTMTSSPSPPDRTTRTVRRPVDDDMARALIRARVHRQHRRAQRVLTRL